MRTNKSIRSKLIQIILVISNVSLLIAFVALYAYETISYRSTIVRQLEVQAKMLADNATAAVAFNDADEALDLLQSLRKEPNIMGAALFRKDSSLLVRYIADGAAPFPVESALKQTISTQEDGLEIVVPVVQEGKALGALYINRSTRDLRDKNIVYLAVVLTVLVLCVSLTYVLTRRLEKSISKPIIDLADIAKLISEKQDYTVRARVHPDGELNTLTHAFNLMLSRIDEQNREIQEHAQKLETKVEERTVEIKRQKEFAETIINSSLVLIAVFDTEFRFIGFNKRCEIEFGMRREDVLGKPFAEAMPQVVGSPAYKAVLRALNGEVVHYEQYRSPVSGEYYENFGIPLFNEKNEVYAALLTAHNITATVTANEKVLRSNEELKRKNADLEQFAYVASHDLQEPLRKIQIFTDRAKTAADPSGDQLRFLQKIEASAQRMSRLIKDVLEYSRLARVEESFIDTDLNVVLEYIRSDFELLITEKNASIQSDVLPVVRGNKLQLHQLFANLISNGLKFNDGSPVINIKLGNLTSDDFKTFALRAETTYCKILFTDNGIGFDPQHKDKLFTIFQRLNPREQYEGTGIGLALCKKIVDNHNGHIEVHSTPNKGTSFTVILPLR